MKLSEEQLRRCHFPRPHPSIMGKAQIFDIESSYFRVVPDSSRRNCKRCLKVYDILANGLPRVEEKCFYHPYRISGRPPRYRCCNRGRNARPCAQASQHANDDVDLNNLNGFVTTKNNQRVNAEDVYAMDCEMIFTTAGIEVACISIVDSNCDLVYETMVLPDNPIIDYNTEHSNLTARDFQGVSTRLKDVHTKLLTLFGDQTILVGHALNNDMLRLKFFHDNIFDTSIAYPHPKGGSFLISLRNLKERYLPPSTVNNNIFKCRDDAIAAMKLALLKCRS